ncbi:MAG TPA: hypothetical protein VN802_16395 [Stellaceae bacterium]|nr:hypothetical protein [Stellaceae bacterium]
MATLVPWTTVELGDLEFFAPAVPCLVVHTWYIDDQPDSTVTYFWQDAATGLINHEMVFAGPVSFEAALAWAQEHAPTRGVERIHVKHGPSGKKRGRPAAKAQPRKKRSPRSKVTAQKKTARGKKRGRKGSSR